MNYKEKAIHGFVWVSSAKAITQGFSWLVTVLLVRLLSPEHYGLLGMAAIFIGFLDLISEMGIQASIIQKQDLDDDDLHTMFWISIFSGLVFFTLAWLIAPLVAMFFGKVELISIFRMLALNLIIGCFRIVPLSVLCKNLAFDKRSLAESLAVVISGVTSVALAILDFGVWTLVYAAIVHNTVFTMLAMYFAQWVPKLVFSPLKARRMLTFGISFVGSTILWSIYTSADSLVIGKLLGDKALGYYSVALTLSNIPIGRVMTVINQVMFPIFSMLQDDMRRLEAYFLKISSFLSLIIFPTMVGLLLVSEEFVLLILTDKWLPMLVPFRVLCLLALLKSLDEIFPTIFFAKGKADFVLRYNLICALVYPVSFVVGAIFGISGVAVAAVIVHSVLSIFLIKHGLAELGVQFLQYVQNLGPAVSASAFMAMVVIAFRSGDRVFYGRDVVFTLVGSCCAGALAYLIFLWAFRRNVVNEVWDLYGFLRSTRRAASE